MSDGREKAARAIHEQGYARSVTGIGPPLSVGVLCDSEKAATAKKGAVCTFATHLFQAPKQLRVTSMDIHLEMRRKIQRCQPPSDIRDSLCWARYTVRAVAGMKVSAHCSVEFMWLRPKREPEAIRRALCLSRVFTCVKCATESSSRVSAERTR